MHRIRGERYCELMLTFVQASRLLGVPDNISPNTPCYNDTREQRTDSAQQLQESDDPSSSSQMPRAEEIDQKIEENPLTSEQTQEPAVLSGSLLPKTQILDQNISLSAGTGGDSEQLKQFGNNFSLLLPKTEVIDHSVSPSFTSQPTNTEVLDQNVTLHPAEDTCGISPQLKQPAAVLISPLRPKAEVLDQSFPEEAVAGPLGSPEQNANAPMSPAQYQTVYLINSGFQQIQSNSVPMTQSSSVPQTQSSSVQKPKGQRRRRVCTRTDCPFCNIPPCGSCRPCTNPDSRSRCILRWVGIHNFL
jgi:hypothetical protein